MSGISFRSLAFMFLIAFLVWSSNIETCIARRGKHWRQSRYAAASLSNKKGKGHSNGHHNYQNGGSKPKAPPHNTTPSTPPSPKLKAPPPPKEIATPSPRPSPTPKEDFPSAPPPQKAYSNGQRSNVFDVLDFGANGDGKTAQ